MRLVVEILTGKLFHVQVNDDVTVADLKKEIEAQEEFPHSRLILILANSENLLMDENERPLAHYGIQDGSHVYLFFKPPADGFPDNFFEF
ncbi:hypothetical protein NMG60_11035461 [Bertholletia excelsa]